MKKTSLWVSLILFLGAMPGLGLAKQPAADIPRPEYPRPQFMRSSWINLNGDWTYVFDFGQSGKQRGLANSGGFEEVITVPFCPESSLSGVSYKDFINAMWYHREVLVPGDWTDCKILLHFGAVDYKTEVFIDGISVGKHWGGTSSFQFDIAPYVTPGQSHHLVVYVVDDLRSEEQPAGKQCPDYNSRGCHYTRTTGIWQTVWMENVPQTGLHSCLIIPDLDQECFYVSPQFYAFKQGQTFRVTVFEGTKKVSQIEIPASPNAICRLPLQKPKTWSPENPHLYQVSLEITDAAGSVIDSVKSYAGLRKVHIEGNRIYLNNEPYYLRLVLDQGFYPDGIWTAPSDEALRKDIELSQKAGFNGARLHQKVFEERFHFWADKLGYLTWGESSSWGFDITSDSAARNFLTEWEEIVVRDRNHPSIVVWTPLNEAWSGGEHLERLITNIYALTKHLDPTRPINDSSGGFHIKTDVWTEHSYEQDPNKLKQLLTPSPDTGVWRRSPKNSIPYGGEPYLLDEYGGIKWIPAKEQQYAEDSWGYGEDPKSLEEFYHRLEALTDVVLSFDHIFGFCYTQLTDIEQEQNGIYNYDRTEKFDMSRIRNIFTRQKERD